MFPSDAQTGMAGFPCSGDVECRTVIDAGADKGQSNGDIHAFVYAQVLDRDQALIVILGNHNIETSLAGVHEDSIARPGSAYIYPFGLGLSDCGTDDFLVFRPKESVLASMRVQPRHGDPVTCNTQLGHGTIGQSN